MPLEATIRDVNFGEHFYIRPTSGLRDPSWNHSVYKLGVVCVTNDQDSITIGIVAIILPNLTIAHVPLCF